MHAERKMGGCGFSFLEVKKVLFYLLSDVTFFMQDTLYNHVP